ncbi:hypothetical protein PAL_GLEAN10016622 [Pteropus alecto]|uniref:Uncharacterized protein n=1 Tax=Pteropus alecto TaxID=9402 RepID=L5L277_PTEAL|nr:hypothetical protein PAL_GLEAN10016622 [Pteropus alecto]
MRRGVVSKPGTREEGGIGRGVDPITYGDSFFNADDGSTHRVADEGPAALPSTVRQGNCGQRMAEDQEGQLPFPPPPTALTVQLDSHSCPGCAAEGTR